MNGLEANSTPPEPGGGIGPGPQDCDEQLKRAQDQMLADKLSLSRREEALSAAEEKLRESERRYQVMVNAIPDGILRFARDDQVDFINPAGERIYTLIQESLVEPGASNIMGSIGDTLRRRVFETGQEAMLEYSLPGENGSRFIRARYLPEFGSGGQVDFVIAILSEITGRRRVEEALRASMMENQRQRELLETISDTDPTGLAVLVGQRLEHRFANPSYRALTPHPELNPLEHPYADIWPPAEGFRGAWLIQRAMETGKPLHLDRYAQTFPDSVTRYFSLDLRRMLWNDQPAVLFVIRETTLLEEAYQRAEQAALESEVAAVTAQASEAVARLRAEEAEERQRALELLTAELERSNKDLEDFAFIASHDLKEPLRKIQVFGDLLKNGYHQQLGEKGSDYVIRMQNASLRMQAMIDDLLRYSQIATKTEPFARVDLNEIAQEVLADLELLIKDTNGRVELGDLPEIEAVPRHMRQLFQNLIGNALKFHQEDIPPVVKVYSRSLPAVAEGNPAEGKPVFALHFVDNGIGFDEAFLERIFQPFQRLHGRSEYHGSGIGLAICRKIALRHGGRITASSKPGQGSEFVVTLPLRQVELDY